MFERVPMVDASPIRETDVLIVGAGPTGLVLALWLTRAGVRVRIVDKTPEAGTTSRALAVQARTLEFYQQLGLAKTVVEHGRWATSANVWVAGRRAVHVVFGEMGAGLSAFPYALIYPQDEHERMLIEHLREVGVEVERRTELVSFEEVDGAVRARIRAADGNEEVCVAKYLAGCDGAHSTVRQGIGVGFPGGTYDHLFYVADVEASGQTMNGELHVALDRNDFLVMFPLREDGRARLIGTVRDEVGKKQEELSWEDVNRKVIEWIRIDVERVNWFSTYRVHHRVAERFRVGRAFLLGDAGHVHSPVGGQGMNTGIGDAVNLAWKLAAVVRGRASASLLESYEPERIAFARRLVATTDRAFVGVTSSGAVARFIRLRLVPMALPLLFEFRAARRLMFRTVSQTAVNYRGSSLSEGQVGAVHGGDRLPWVQVEARADFKDNFGPLRSMDWQMHVYGEAGSELWAVCEARKLALWVFAWTAAMGRAGLQRDAIYLVRPDGYVAVVTDDGGGSAVAGYLDARRIVQAV
jgi:2-polyprenyl-6-methoxyphenol hydroxylase-like FAD-dependent oxidoreductase